MKGRKGRVLFGGVPRLKRFHFCLSIASAHLHIMSLRLLLSIAIVAYYIRATIVLYCEVLYYYH